VILSIPFAPVRRDCNGSFNVFTKSHPVTVGLLIPGMASPVPFAIGGCIYDVEPGLDAGARWCGAGD